MNRSEIVLHYLLTVEWCRVPVCACCLAVLFICVCVSSCRQCASKFENDYVVKADKLHFSVVASIREHIQTTLYLILDAYCAKCWISFVQEASRMAFVGVFCFSLCSFKIWVPPVFSLSFSLSHKHFVWNVESHCMSTGGQYTICPTHTASYDLAASYAFVPCTSIAPFDARRTPDDQCPSRSVDDEIIIARRDKDSSRCEYTESQLIDGLTREWRAKPLCVFLHTPAITTRETTAKRGEKTAKLWIVHWTMMVVACDRNYIVRVEFNLNV